MSPIRSRPLCLVMLIGMVMSSVMARPSLAQDGAAPAQPAQISAAEYLRSLQPPTFRQGHTMPRLGRWGWTLPLDLSIELADRWGYALEVTGSYMNHKMVERIRSQPDSDMAKAIALAAREPDRFPLQVILSRDLPRGEADKDIATALNLEGGPGRDADVLLQNTGQDAGSQADADNVRTESEATDPFLRDAQGRLIVIGQNKQAIWSPEAPRHFLEESAALRADPLREIAAMAPVALVLNGGEYALDVSGHRLKEFEQDPRVVKARGDTPWFDYLSIRKGRMERVIADAVRAASPGRQLYIYYTTSGGPHRNRWPGWSRWAFDFKHMHPISDLPSTESYYQHYNSGWMGDIDLLTAALNAKAYQFTFDYPHSYDWFCAGWERKKPEDDRHGDLTLYQGFLKVMYTTGSRGGVAGYFAFPRAKGGFAQQIDLDQPPHWLAQMLVLGHVHALFTHLDGFIKASDLLPGPDRHAWSKELPAYEFPTDKGKQVRILARRGRDAQSDHWLLVAWAADGQTQSVTVDIPELGQVNLEARPQASLYHATRQDQGVRLTRLDDDLHNPSAHVPATPITPR